MEKTAPHTPTPWVIRKQEPGHCIRGTEHLYSVVKEKGHDDINGVDVYWTLAENMTPEDAHLTVTAVNAFAFDLHKRCIAAIGEAMLILEKISGDNPGADVLYTEMSEILEDDGR